MPKNCVISIQITCKNNWQSVNEYQPIVANSQWNEIQKVASY